VLRKHFFELIDPVEVNEHSFYDVVAVSGEKETPVRSILSIAIAFIDVGVAPINEDLGASSGHLACD